MATAYERIQMKRMQRGGGGEQTSAPASGAGSSSSSSSFPHELGPVEPSGEASSSSSSSSSSSTSASSATSAPEMLSTADTASPPPAETPDPNHGESGDPGLTAEQQSLPMESHGGAVPAEGDGGALCAQPSPEQLAGYANGLEVDGMTQYVLEQTFADELAAMGQGTDDASFLQELEQQQQKLREEVRKRKDLVAQALGERLNKAIQEAEVLNVVRAELSRLDELCQADIVMLRAKTD
eukprot:RCo035695